MAISKYVLPVVAGTMSGGILIKSGERALQYMYPLPAGVDVNDKAALANAIKDLPASAFSLLLVIYFICAFIAGIVATALVGRSTPRPALVAGAVLTLAGLFNIIKVSQPLWFSCISLAGYIPFTYLGYMVMRSKEKVSPAI